MMYADGVVQLVVDQLTEVQTEQPALELVAYTGKMMVRGTVCFSIDHADHTYRDCYEVEITIPSDYPASPPTVKETGGVVPADFHRFPSTGDLCLAVKVELFRVFAQDRSLRHYIKQLLIPYLFSYTYFREHAQLPHGQLSHGLKGLREYYCEFFAVTPIMAMQFLKLLADEVAPPLMLCPCNSGRRLQDCHGPKLDELRPLLPPEHFEGELRNLREYYCEFFAVTRITAMKLLKLLADEFAPPLMLCPCNSGRRLQDCHGPKLDELRLLLPPEHFEGELREMIVAAQAAKIRLPERAVMPKHMLHNRQKRHHKEARMRRWSGT